MSQLWRFNHHDLLGGPMGGWMCGHIEVQYLETVMAEDDEYIENTKCGRACISRMSLRIDALTGKQLESCR